MYEPPSTFDTFGEENGLWRNGEPSASAVLLVCYGRKPTETLKDVYDEFAAFYMTPENKVPWQDRYQ